MFLFFFWFPVYVWRDNFLEARDWIWLRRIRDMISNHNEIPGDPAIQRRTELLLITLILCLIGLYYRDSSIWRVYFSAYFPIGLIRLAALLHAFLAFQY